MLITSNSILLNFILEVDDFDPIKITFSLNKFYNITHNLKVIGVSWILIVTVKLL